MSSSLYRSYLRLLEKWPVDATKKGRDLGEYIRTGVATAFRGGIEEPRDSRRCEEICTRLNNLSKNRYKEAFEVTNSSSASGLSQEECHQLISNEALKEFDRQEKSIKDKFMDTFKKGEGKGD